MCEQPNSRMHQFVGSLDWKGRQYGLDISNVLLRGSRVRNTDACYGLVIYAGTAGRGFRGLSIPGPRDFTASASAQK